MSACAIGARVAVNGFCRGIKETPRPYTSGSHRPGRSAGTATARPMLDEPSRQMVRYNTGVQLAAESPEASLSAPDRLTARRRACKSHGVHPCLRRAAPRDVVPVQHSTRMQPPRLQSGAGLRDRQVLRSSGVLIIVGGRPTWIWSSRAGTSPPGHRAAARGTIRGHDPSEPRNAASVGQTAQLSSVALGCLAGVPTEGETRWDQQSAGALVVATSP
jgi:hypothetical protein